MMRRISLLALLACLFSIVAGQAKADHLAALESAAASILADDLQRHVDVLADDSFEGREAGARGGFAAGGYLIRELTSLKLEPAGENGAYIQAFAGGRNILAVLPGSDPDLKDEYVLIGAHYDHVGYGTQSNSYGPFGYVHNGADDNASGVAGVLETAQAYLEMPVRPRRSILFAFWDGEEKGLLGSQYFVRNPTVPLRSIALAFNCDMIGHLRPQGLDIFGVRSANQLRRLVAGQNDDLKLRFPWELKANSDHHSFFSYGVPTLMFHTGLHDLYHRPSDDAETVDSEGMQRVSRLLFRSSWAVAQLDASPRFRDASRSEREPQRKTLELPSSPQPPRLGLAWKRTPAGYLEVTVSQGAAAEVGLVAGDRLTALDGEDLPADDDQLRLRILAAKEPLRWTVLRDGESLEIETPLRGAPVRIGLSWRPDLADPSLVVVTEIRDGGAADLAGVQTGDRILEVEAESFAGSDGLFALLTRLPAPIRLTLEREGILREVQLYPLADGAPVLTTP